MEENRNNIEADNNNAIKEHYRRIGSKGGRALIDKCGREHMSALGKKSAAKRWGPKDT